jgi:hypothetical protein
MIARLKADILIFEDMKSTGEPWPGKLDGQKSGQQHSV